MEVNPFSTPIGSMYDGIFTYECLKKMKPRYGTLTNLPGVNLHGSSMMVDFDSEKK